MPDELLNVTVPWTDYLLYLSPDSASAGCECRYISAEQNRKIEAYVIVSELAIKF